MSIKKKYLIELFLKCSGHLFAAKETLKANESLLRASYPSIDNNNFSNIILSCGLESYLTKTTILLDSIFSQEEVESLISFFSSSVGRKLVDKSYLLKISILINDITNERNLQLSRLDRE